MPHATELIQYAIYDSPSDYPGQYVVRRWTIGAQGAAPDQLPHHVGPTLEGARASLPPGLYRMERFPFDDPVVVEVWL